MIVINTVVMVFYYLISAFLGFLLLRNFLKEKKNVDEMLMNLIVLLPLFLRLLRIK
ncbi:MAG: hypothetical protein JW747_03035 [Candidatus Aminicenantes bacterium]|nr:hypothetical protein [Candidatus Aminicenantes bacterium]